MENCFEWERECVTITISASTAGKAIGGSGEEVDKGGQWANGGEDERYHKGKEAAS